MNPTLTEILINMYNLAAELEKVRQENEELKKKLEAVPAPMAN